MMDARPDDTARREAQDSAAAGPAAGRMVVVVGPSGAGKDTLMSHAAEALRTQDGISFVRRAITRPADAGGEEHDGVSEDEFLRLEKEGRFAVTWQAHGLHYGIPAETVDAVQAGQIVVANGSRSALPRFKAAYDKLTVVNIIASPDVLAARLAARGRESEDDIRRRLERGSLSIKGDYFVVTIDNSGDIKAAAGQMVDALRQCLQSIA